MFKNIIARKPSNSLVSGITSAPELGKPNIELAKEQHAAYLKALEKCDVNITLLEPEEAFPDSVFVEDPAVLTTKCAIITKPGALSRKGEEEKIIAAVKKFYKDENIEYIKSPGTIEGGDVMMVGDTFYLGLSARTNEEGAKQFKAILEKYGYKLITVPLKKVLHLKTGLAYLENNNLLVSGEFITSAEFNSFNKIIVGDDELYGSNAIWVNNKVIVAKGYPKVQAAIEALGYEVIVVDTSEYRKIDGGLSCMSLRF